MQLVDNDTVSLLCRLGTQNVTHSCSSYLGCPRCFSRQRNTGLYGSRIRDVRFTAFVISPLFSLGRTVTHDGDDAMMGASDDSREYPCLVRVTDGKENKFSTQVPYISWTNAGTS
jgi:hypothetical protein